MAEQPGSIPQFPEAWENILLRFDAEWDSPQAEELGQLCPSDANADFILELIRIDVQKRMSAGRTLDEGFYLRAFAGLSEQPEAMKKLRQITMIPHVGDSVLMALAATTPNLPHINLPEPAAESNDRQPHPSGGSIYRYRFEGEIARGGMGAVLRGRDEDLGREIAVKVMLQNHAGKTELLQRFVEEAQIAGQLQHPGITPVYELGRFPDQRPYFTMKLVRGETLARLLHDRISPAQERARFLKVFEQICQTLAYAHARKVIHRDLKPHNIMVGSFGEVQVMDWGLAKVLSTRAGHSSKVAIQPKASQEENIQTRRSSGQSTDIPNTQAGSILGTPAYMAPEQARGEIDQLDERADVFGLGAILCEILTGLPPYTGSDGFDIFRKAADADLGDAKARLEGCHADKELIELAKRCLAEQPALRPRDASALTKELTDYLHSVEERLKEAELKAVEAKTKAEEETKRRKITMRLAAGILMTVLTGLVASLWQMNRAMTAEQLARDESDAKELQRKEAVTNLAYAKKGNEILGSVFSGLDPKQNYTTVAQLRSVLRDHLLKAVKELEESSIGDPKTVAEMQGTLAESLVGLGSADLAITIYQKVHATCTKLLGDDHEGTLTAMNNLAHCYQLTGQHEKSVALYQKTLDRRKATLGPDHVDTLHSMNNLASGLQDAGQKKQASALYQETLKLRKAHLGADHVDTLLTMNNIASLLQEAGQWKQAVAMNEEVLKHRKVKLGLNDPLTLASMNNLAASHQGANQLDQALELYLDVQKRRRTLLGVDHPDTLITMNNLGEIYRALGDYPKAISILEETRELMRPLQGMDNRYKMTNLNNLSVAYLHGGNPEKAVALVEPELASARGKGEGLDTITAAFTATLAQAYQKTGKKEKAIPLLEEHLKWCKAKHGPSHFETLLSMNNLGGGFKDLGQAAKALPIFAEAARLMEQHLGKDDPITLTCVHNLAGCYVMLRQFDKALAISLENQELFQKRLGPDNPQTLTSRTSLATCYYELRQFDKAIPLYTDVAARRKARFGLNHPGTLSMMRVLAQSYAAAGQLDKAVELYEEVIPLFIKRFGPNHTEVLTSQGSLIRAYTETNQAGKVKALYPDYVKGSRKLKQNDPERLSNFLSNVAADLIKCRLYVDAEAMLKESLELHLKVHPDTWPTFLAKARLGAALLGKKQYAEAETWLLQGYEGLKARQDKIPPMSQTRIRETVDLIIQLYTEMNKSVEVKKWQAEKQTHSGQQKKP